MPCITGNALIIGKRFHAANEFSLAMAPFAGALVALFQQEQQRWDSLLGSIRGVLAERGPRSEQPGSTATLHAEKIRRPAMSISRC